MTKKPNDLQARLLRHYDCADGLPSERDGTSLSAMVKRGWMEKIAGYVRPGFTQRRRWRTTEAGRKAAAS